MLAIDTETTPEFDAFCVTTAYIDPTSGNLHSAYWDLNDPVDYQDVKDIIEGTGPWIFHNAKFDIIRLIDAGLLERDAVTPFSFHDTETLAHLLDPNRRRGLKHLAEHLLGETTDEAEALNAEFRKLKLKKSDGYHRLPKDVLMPYAIKDAEFTIKLYNRLLDDWNQIPADDPLRNLYDLERELTVALLDMERAGIGLDLDYLETTSLEYRRTLGLLEIKCRELAGDEQFNPYSPVQLIDALDARGIKVPNTQSDTLKTHLDDPFVQTVLELRSTKKISTTYLEALRNERKGDIFHGNFRQHGARTGRMSSGAAENN